MARKDAAKAVTCWLTRAPDVAGTLYCIKIALLLSASSTFSSHPESAFSLLQQLRSTLKATHNKPTCYMHTSKKQGKVKRKSGQQEKRAGAEKQEKHRRFSKKNDVKNDVVVTPEVQKEGRQQQQRM